MNKYYQVTIDHNGVWSMGACVLATDAGTAKMIFDITGCRCDDIFRFVCSGNI